MVSLDKLCEIVSSDINRLFLSLDIDLKKGSRYYSGSCFHGSDNPHSLSVYERNGCYYWTCKTKSCEKVFNRSIIGLARGVLSATKEGWSEQGDKLYPFSQTLDFLKTLYNITGKDIQVTEEYLEKKGLSGKWKSCKARVIPSFVPVRII